MSDLKTQIRAARDERETGDPKKALEMFLEIDKSQLDPNQVFDYLGELGLTYWHLKDYPKARTTFEEALAYAEKTNNKSYSAVALRHLARPEFNSESPDNAVSLARQARDLAFEAGRQDLAWFDHGVVTTLIFNKASFDEIKKWFDIEAEDLYNTSRNTKDDIAKWVWTCGLLIDRSHVFDSIADLYIALMIAEQFNLARRKEQIEEMISKFNNK
ncbi:tetratricopeptide repeat protein [candidate division WWE3 bacterium]|jgi:tetratricopeptide (TPR) repeat protein|uniref:Tetratricopeptide repeat protein n=1 Tax=candidate division WWE3 bacterium TaxID=2053526 RepID=A0A3A4ZDC7_UNCKA|nr:MAG: tetratricopeptide repeat protein [candidate division WWE3 bacterium]